MGYVYFIGSQTFGWYKIGKSRQPRTRIRQLGILLPFRIDVFAVWRSHNATTLERSLHEKYSEFGINGEWFHFTPQEALSVMLDPSLDRVYPIQGAEYGFIAVSNVKHDRFHFDKKRFTKRGKQRPSREKELQLALKHKAYRKAWRDYMAERGIPDTPENRQFARKCVESAFTPAGKEKF